MVIIILAISGIIHFTLRKNKSAKYILLIIEAIIFIPMSVSAICSCIINVESTIQIKKEAQGQNTFTGIKYGVYKGTNSMTINEEFLQMPKYT